MIRIVDVPDMNYFADNNQGEVSTFPCIFSPCQSRDIVSNISGRPAVRPCFVSRRYLDNRYPDSLILHAHIP